MSPSQPFAVHNNVFISKLVSFQVLLQLRKQTEITLW